MEIEIKVVDSYQMTDKQYWKRIGKFYADNVWTKTAPATAAENVKMCFSSFEYEYAVKWFEVFACKDREIVGLMRILRNPETDTRWFFCDVHTAVRYRHQGIASKMYEKAIELVKKYEAAECIIASVSASNGKSVGLHKKLGFTDTKRIPSFANFEFEEDETEYELMVYNEYKALNSDVHKKILRKLYKEYLLSKGQNDTKGISATVNALLKNAEEDEFITFSIIWNGNNPVGFKYESLAEKHEYIRAK